MPSTFFGLTIAMSGINAANVSINTAAHNISNLETTGYSRQQTQVTAADPLRAYASYGMIGSGVSVNSIQQVRDSYYDYKYWSNNGTLGEHTTKNYYLSQIEPLFYNKEDKSGFTKTYGEFCNALDALSSTPADLKFRNNAIQQGENLAEYFKNVAENLRILQNECNTQVSFLGERINTISKNIANLNKQINTLELNGGFANDLRDQRNVLVDELSEIIGITVTEETSDTGSVLYNIRVNGHSLVSGFTSSSLSPKPRDTDKPRNENDIEGLYDLYWDDGSSFDMYNADLKGEIKGYFEIRDGNNLEKPLNPPNGKGIDYKGIPYYMAEINKFVSTYTKEFNKIHMSGKNLENNGSTAEIPFFTISGMTVKDIKDAADADTAWLNQNAAAYAKEQGKDWDTMTPGEQANAIQDYKDADGGRLIYDYISDHVTSENVCVNPDIIANHKLMATATDTTDGVDTPDIIHQLNNLKSQIMLQGGTAENFMENLVSISGIDCKAAADMQNNHDYIKKSIINQRLSVSGVDKEEEAIDLVKFRQAYNLSSKVVSIMQQLYDKLINQTGI